jgi:hypothetical protein
MAGNLVGFGFLVFFGITGVSVTNGGIVDDSTTTSGPIVLISKIIGVDSLTGAIVVVSMFNKIGCSLVVNKANESVSNFGLLVIMIATGVVVSNAASIGNTEDVVVNNSTSTTGFFVFGRIHGGIFDGFTVVVSKSATVGVGGSTTAIVVNFSVIGVDLCFGRSHPASTTAIE